MGFKNIKGIIFDFGFTLFYFKNATVEKYLDCYERGLKRCSQKLAEMEILKSRSEERRFRSKFNKKRMKSFQLSRKTNEEYLTSDIFREVGDEMLLQISNEEYSQIATLYHSCEEEEWIPFKNTEHTLQRLVKLDLKLAVLSNHPHHITIENMLKSLGLVKYFDVIITSASYGKRKPHPAIFKYTLNKMGFGEDEASLVLMVGDEYADIMGAHRTGLQKIFFQRTVEFPFEKEIPLDNYEKIKEISEILNYI